MFFWFSLFLGNFEDSWEILKISMYTTYTKKLHSNVSEFLILAFHKALLSSKQST